MVSAGIVGLLYLPQDVSGLPDALQPFGRWIALVDRETLFLVGMLFFGGWVAWLDFRPFVTRAFTRFRHRRTGNGPAEPEKSWIPYWSAPFSIPKLPQYEASGWTRSDAYLNHMLVGQVAKEKGPDNGLGFNPDTPLARANNGDPLYAAYVDWENRQFTWEWQDATDSTRKIGVRIAPWDVESGRFAATPMTQEYCKFVQKRGAFVWGIMQEPIERLIDEGNLVLWGRPDSPTASFRRISWDSFRHFDIVDWPRGRAQSTNGEQLYSLHVEPMSKLSSVLE